MARPGDNHPMTGNEDDRAPSAEPIAADSWLTSRERERATQQHRIGTRLLLAALPLAFGAAAIAIVAVLLGSYRGVVAAGIVAIISIVLATTGGIARLSYSLTRRRFLEREEAIHRALAVRRAAAKVEDALSLPNLFGFNRTLMEEYHSITKGQSERSFRYSQIASFVGLFILAGGAVVVFVPVSDLVKIAIAGLAGLGTILSGYISRTFLRSHELSIQQLNNFFRQPLVSNYLLMAERLANDLSTEARSEAQLRIIEQIIEAARRAEEQVPPPGTAPRVPRVRRAAERDPIDP